MILKVLDHYGEAFDWTPNTGANSGGEIRQRQSDLGSYEKRSPWQKMYYTSDAMIAPFPMAPFPLINAPTIYRRSVLLSDHSFGDDQRG